MQLESRFLRSGASSSGAVHESFHRHIQNMKMSPRNPQCHNNQAINAMISCILHELEIQYRQLCANCAGPGRFRRFPVHTRQGGRRSPLELGNPWTSCRSAPVRKTRSNRVEAMKPQHLTLLLIAKAAAVTRRSRRVQSGKIHATFNSNTPGGLPDGRF